MRLLCRRVDRRFGGWTPYALAIGVEPHEIEALRRRHPLRTHGPR
jgi:hypothetical protein